jgi:hypothetical protein
MPLVELAGSTQNAVIGTEHTLAETGGTTLPTARNYILRVGLSAMAAGDVVELRIYTKVLSDSTADAEYSVSYAHRQGTPNVVSVPVAAVHYIKVTLKQAAGTARAFDWSVVSVDG